MRQTAAFLSLAVLASSAAAKELETAYQQQAAAAKTSAAGIAARAALPAAKQAVSQRQAKGQEKPVEESHPEVKACNELAAKQPVIYDAWRLVLVTEQHAYYTHSDCDICDALDRCELKSPRMESVLTQHSVGCSDIARFKVDKDRKPLKILFDECAGRR